MLEEEEQVMSTADEAMRKTVHQKDRLDRELHKEAEAEALSDDALERAHKAAHREDHRVLDAAEEKALWAEFHEHKQAARSISSVEQLDRYLKEATKQAEERALPHVPKYTPCTFQFHEPINWGKVADERRARSRA